jgi:dTMP kinase
MIISLEGVNGAGKSTTAKAVARNLTAMGKKARYARLPGDEGLPQTKAIRDLLKDHEWGGVSKLYLYLADMAEFYRHLRDDVIYVMDRSYLSTLVYQSSDGVPPEVVLNAIEHAGLYIDKTILLTCDIDVAMERMGLREHKTVGGYADREAEFYEEIQESYKKFAETPWVYDTTNCTEEQTIEAVMDYLELEGII